MRIENNCLYKRHLNFRNSIFKNGEERHRQTWTIYVWKDLQWKGESSCILYLWRRCSLSHNSNWEPIDLHLCNHFKKTLLALNKPGIRVHRESVPNLKGTFTLTYKPESMLTLTSNRAPFMPIVWFYQAHFWGQRSYSQSQFSFQIGPFTISRVH